MAAQLQSIAFASAKGVAAPRRARSQLRVSAVAEVERVATNGTARVSGGFRARNVSAGAAASRSAAAVSAASRSAAAVSQQKLESAPAPCSLG